MPCTGCCRLRTIRGRWYFCIAYLGRSVDARLPSAPYTQTIMQKNSTCCNSTVLAINCMIARVRRFDDCRCEFIWRIDTSMA